MPSSKGAWIYHLVCEVKHITNDTVQCGVWPAPLGKEKPSTMTLKERKFYLWLEGGDGGHGSWACARQGQWYLRRGQKRAEVKEGCVREST